MIVVFVGGEREGDSQKYVNNFTSRFAQKAHPHISIYMFHALLSWYHYLCCLQIFPQEPFCWLKARGVCGVT